MRRSVCHSFAGAVGAGAVLLLTVSAGAQILFEADWGTGSIYEFTTNGVRSTFASGLGGPHGLAFDSAGNLFVADYSDNIYEFTFSGMMSTFASGSSHPMGLAFDSAGDLFMSDTSGYIWEFPPNGGVSMFASGLSIPQGLAFEEAIPEPSTWTLVGLGLSALLVFRRRSVGSVSGE